MTTKQQLLSTIGIKVRLKKKSCHKDSFVVHPQGFEPRTF
jgi:hypothetical protein